MNRGRPSRALEGARTALAFVGGVEIGVGVILVFFMTAAIAVGVFFRYVLGSSLVFVEEAVTIAFIWTTFLGAAVAAKMKRHIVITTISAVGSDRGRDYMDLFCNLFVLIIAVAVAVFAIQYVGPQNRSRTVSLPFNFPRGWVFAIPTIYAMASIAITQLVYSIDSAVRVFRRRGRRPPFFILGG